MCKIKNDVLKIKRIEKGMTQIELASALGVNKSAMSNYERGKADPTEEVAQKMAFIFDMELNELKALDTNTSNAVINGRAKNTVPTIKRYVSPIAFQSIINGYRSTNSFTDNVLNNEMARSLETSNWNKAGNKYYVTINTMAINIPEWQRDTDTVVAKYISENYKENKFDPVKVYLKDGRFYLADGAHRLMASLFSNKTFIQAELLLNTDRTFISETDAIQMFLEQSLGRKNMTQGDMWRGSIKNNLTHHVKLKEICDHNKLQINKDLEKIAAPRGTVNVSGRMMSMVQRDPALLDRVLRLINKLEWNAAGKGNPYNHNVVGTLFRLFINSDNRASLEENMIRKVKGATYFEDNIAILNNKAAIVDRLSADLHI